METPEYGIAAMRRGSYDDATAPLRPHLRNLAQRRRSAPSLVFGKALGMPWSPIREEASCWVAVEQSPFVLGLSSVNGELLLDECVQVTEGTKTRERHLFLFHDAIVFTKLKSTASYRLKHRVSLEDIWLYGFEDEVEDEEGMTGDIDLRVTIILAWDLTFCLVCFRTPEVKERWLDTLHRRIKDAKARAGCASSPPDVLMKVLSGSVATKTLTGVSMEQQVIVLDGNANISAVSKLSNHQEDKQTQPTETKWKEVVRKLKKGSSFINKTGRSAQLFGLPLCKICPDDCSLPKPVTEMLMLLRKNGPSTEGIFRKPCNSKNMRDIREQLNGGLEVDLKGQSVSLLVGLLKTFLKELPGCLLVSELYDVWMKAMDNEDTQQRVLEVRKVVDMLPRPNKLLLQHLVCVLYHILENADTNKMDAHNLAVCIAPTLLQLNSTPLDEQMEKTQKVTDLTQFLIEHFEILGDNIPNLLDTDEDSLSSQHHDSAYDSTDPEGDGEAGESTGCVQRECGSSSSLIPSITTSSWTSDTTLNTKPEFNRRCSEPIILLSPELQDLCCHARSHDDCSVERRDFEEQPLKKQISDDSFLHRGQGNARLGLSFQKLSSSCNVDPRLYNANRVKDWSCSSLESTTSNQSEGSVFTSSPAGSPSCSRRADPANQTAEDAKAQQDFARPNSEEKRRSQSVRGPNKVIMRTRSLITFNRSSLKKDPQKEISFPCETLQEDSQSEADSPAEPLQKSRPLSAIEVFKHVDSRLPCRPPPYSQAVQNVSLPPVYNKSMTVQAAIELKRRSRPSSVNYDYTDYVPQAIQDKASVVNQPFRQRAMSESVSSSHRELLSRRCSQPVFEESSYPKESYV